MLTAPTANPAASLLLKLGPVAFRALLRGLGRAAWRAHTTAAGSVAYAQRTTGPLSSADRLLVMSGWRDESDAGMEVV